MNEKLKYKFLILARYLGDALYYPFISLFLKSNGLIPSEIGFILSISPMIGILLNPVYSKLAKTLKASRRILIIITICEAICVGLIPFFHNLIGITIMIVLIAIFNTSHFGLMDSLVAVFCNKQNIEFANLRVFGSIAYIFGTTIGGLIINKVSYIACFIVSAIILIVSALFYIYIKPIEQENAVIKHSYSSLFKNKKFMGYLIVHVLIFSILNSTNSFFSLFLKENGISENQYGYIYSFYVTFEVITFIILSKAKKHINMKYIQLIALILMILRFIINSSNLPIIVPILFSCVQGILWALLLNSYFPYLVNLLGDKEATSGNMLLVLITNIFQIALSNINGRVIGKYGYQTFYKYCLLLALIPLVIVIIRIIKTKKEAK